MTLPGNILVPYKWLQLLDRLPRLRGIAREGTVHVVAYFSTRSGISLWSLLVLVGVDDAEEHGISWRECWASAVISLTLCTQFRLNVLRYF